MICDKIPYDTYKEALAAVKAISSRDKAPMRVYKCSECPNKFHLTSVKHRQSKVFKEKIKPTTTLYELSPGYEMDKKVKNALISGKGTRPLPAYSQPLATFKLGDVMKGITDCFK